MIEFNQFITDEFENLYILCTSSGVFFFKRMGSISYNFFFLILTGFLGDSFHFSTAESFHLCYTIHSNGFCS